MKTFLVGAVGLVALSAIGACTQLSALETSIETRTGIPPDKQECAVLASIDVAKNYDGDAFRELDTLQKLTFVRGKIASVATACEIDLAALNTSTSFIQAALYAALEREG